MESDKNQRGHTIRVVVVDNTRIHTQLLADALRRDAGLDVTSTEPNSQALFATIELHRPDVLLISSTLDEDPSRGLSVLRELHSSQPELRAVVLLDSSKDEVILGAFRAGARGIFRRHESIETLRECVRSIHQGKIWANHEELALALKALAASPTVQAVNSNGRALLSRRELEVVQSLAEGLTNQEIAARLGLSQHTVKNYLFRVFDKLGVSNRIELLFMTLSERNALSGLAENNPGAARTMIPWESISAAECEKAAADGILPAQIGLAQKIGNKNPVAAYAWYLIALEQISKATKSMLPLMGPEQIVEAERRAAEWMSRSKKRPAVSPVESEPSGLATSTAATAD
jgi:DNA-binding NarL/FixJ family response regulator